MSKRPWMPLYIGDFTADTMHLSATEIGIYIQLIMHCWQHNGTIPTDRRKLARIAHCDIRLWHQHEATVLQFFDVVDASTMQQKRCVDELRRYAEISNKRKGAAEQMLVKRAANAEQMLTHARASSQSHIKKEHPSGFEVKQDSPESEAWEKHLGRRIGFGRSGIRTMPSQWPSAINGSD